MLRTKWLVPRRRPYVLVINDLETRLSALQPFAIRDWLTAHPNSFVVATLSAEGWDDLLKADKTPLNSAAVKVLGDAREVELGDEFKGKALKEARRLYNLPEGQTRLGAFLASAQRTIAAYQASGGKCPTARPLALSAINCARAGLARPIELAKLLELARRITTHDEWTILDEDWNEAVRYCTPTQDGDTGILELARTRGDSQMQWVTVNPVLVEFADRTPGGARSTSLPDHVWEAVIDVVAEGPEDFLAIASAAERRDRADIARALLVQLKEGESGVAADTAKLTLETPNRSNERPEVSELLYRASFGPEPRVKDPTSVPRLNPTPSRHTDSETFDPSYDRSAPWYAFYRQQAIRDVARFCLLLVCDTTAVGAGIVAARQLGAVALNPSGDFSSSLTVAAVATILVLIFFLLFGLYRADRERARLGEIIKGTGLAATALALLALGNGYSLINVPLVLVAAGGASGLAFFFRWLYDRLSRNWVVKHRLQSRALVVAAKHPTAIAELICQACRRPTQMVGYLATGQAGDEHGWLGAPDNLEVIVHTYQVNRVIFADPGLTADERLALIYRCHALDIATDVVPTAAELFQGGSDALDDLVVPLIAVRPLYFGYVNKRAKRIMDLVLALPLSVAALVLLAPITLTMKIQSWSESVLVPEYRPGLGAIPFGMWRLRTASNGRTTGLGRLLKRLRIDEVPQLMNVLAGEMSLVGPRPLTREEFEELDVFQKARYAVLPGLTGLWQVARRKETSLDDMATLDIVYCRNWTPLLDLTILLRTIPAVLAPPAREWVPESGDRGGEGYPQNWEAVWDMRPSATSGLPVRRRYAADLRGILAMVTLRLLTTVFVRGVGTTVGGVVSERLHSLDLERALPRGFPPQDVFDSDDAYGTEVSPVLARATAWAVALIHADGSGHDLAVQEGVLTTYGFARIEGQVRLAVIRYLPARIIPDLNKVAPVCVGGHVFPVVLRPLMASGHGPSRNGSGTCWVTFNTRNGRRRGILTARHAVKPVGSAEGDSVSIDARRNDPTGQLHVCSVVMDAAVVDIGEDVGQSERWDVSKRVGYKPVRLLGSSGAVDTDVVEFTGVAGATIPGVAGQEPLAAVLLFLGKRLQKGDSGCLGLDLEPTLFGGEPAPYLIYQGRTNLRFGGGAGYGLLLEQARKVWTLEVHNGTNHSIEGSAI